MELFVIELICVICLNVLHFSDGGRTYTYPGVKLSDVPDPFYHKDTGFLDATCLKKYFPDKNARHECDRKCVVNETRICYYRFNIETKEAHNPDECSNPDNRDCIITDGVRNPIHVINRQLPGPLIAVCLGDRVVVDVANYMVGVSKRVSTEDDKNATEPILIPDANVKGESTTIHFHGIIQTNTSHSDGVPTLSQAPIVPGSFYRYSFVTDNDGTHFYYAHTLGQKSEGVFGPMIVRDPLDFRRRRYQVEYTVMISDYSYNKSRFVNNMLINSHGCVRKNNSKATGYITQFEVEKDKNYRFRFIHNGFEKVLCFVDKHVINLIATDGTLIHLKFVTSFIIAAGERLDFIIKASEPIGNYLLLCRKVVQSKLHQVAILHYKTAEKAETDCSKIDFSIRELEPAPMRVQYQPVNMYPRRPPHRLYVHPHEVASIAREKIERACNSKEARKIVVDFKGNSTRDYFVNDIDFDHPPKALLNHLIDKGHLNDSDFCDKHGSCLDVWRLNQGRCIELAISTPYPVHIHGVSFYLMDFVKNFPSGKLTQKKFFTMDNAYRVHRNFINPPQRDTLSTPPDGAHVIRFFTHNPGFVFIHALTNLREGTKLAKLFWINPRVDFTKRKDWKHHHVRRLNNKCFN